MNDDLDRKLQRIEDAYVTPQLLGTSVHGRLQKMRLVDVNAPSNRRERREVAKMRRRERRDAGGTK